MGLSIWQIIIVVGLLLLFFGPSRIPGLGKSLGEAIRGFKKGLDDDEIDVSRDAKRIESEEKSASETVKAKESEKA
jgi:sec-independent protein translocase protein TatA